LNLLKFIEVGALKSGKNDNHLEYLSKTLNRILKYSYIVMNHPYHLQVENEKVPPAKL